MTRSLRRTWNKVLKGRVAERARDLIRQICEARDVVIVRGSVSPDHLHMLLWVPADLAPAKLVQYIKSRSSRRLQDEFPELRKRYWGQHLWARGYFCATVGAVDEATIREYIENQKWDEDDQGFKITAPAEPQAGLSLDALQAALAAPCEFQSQLNPTPYSGGCLATHHRTGATNVVVPLAAV
ncbi:MAG: IS200/IS605 family transposase [Acidobacteria bacterium]|nr:IS200/IS605 family transposase [Acidobacteriota bacterium]